MIGRILILMSLSALSAVSLASPVSATTFVHQTSPTGPLYSGSITAPQIGNSSVTATDGSGKTISCLSGSLGGTTSNSAGNPSVSGTLTTLQLSTCTSNTYPVITEFTASTPGSMSLTASGAGTGTFTIGSLTVLVKSGTTTICNYTWTNVSGSIASAPGGLANGQHILFANAGGITSSSFACPITTHFNATFGPLQGSSGQKLFVNTA